MMIIKYYKTINYKSFIINAIILSLLIINNLPASGAFDKGTSAGKGNWELNLTLNPFNIISYGQNYGVLSYGLTKSVDLVTYYSIHRDGLNSFYFGGLYQFTNNPLLDLAVATGWRKVYDKSKGYDIFFPQLLYNYKLSKNFTLGGSLVNVINISNGKNIDKGYTIDVTVYKKIDYFNKVSPKIIDVYFGVGVFKNTEMDLEIDDLYLQYSLDIRFNSGKN